MALCMLSANSTCESTSAILLQHRLSKSSKAQPLALKLGVHHNPAGITRRSATISQAMPSSLPRSKPYSHETVYSFYTDVAPPASTSDGSSTAQLRQLPRAVEGVADDPSIHNPLQRMERLGTGWMGVILELDGVLVEDTAEAEKQAWQQLASEEGKPMPLQFALKRALGMKAEQVIQEVFCWSRNPSEVRRLSGRKETLYLEALGERKPMLCNGVMDLLETLRKNDVPVALVSTAPEARVQGVLHDTDTLIEFETVISAEDVARGRPDPEALIYASQSIGRPPARCVVIGNSNQSIEAAHEVGMQCITVAGRTPVYELTAADLVVRNLSDLSFVNLKQLFRNEDTVSSQLDGDLEVEMEEDTATSLPTTTITMDW